MVLAIYYIVSILSIFFYVISVQFKEKKNILSSQILASSCYLIVYIIKGAWSGVFIEILEAVKNYSFLRFEKIKKEIPIGLLVLFIGLLVLVSIIFYDGILSLLPLLINVLLFISTYYKNPKYIRWIMLVCGCLWALYNFYVGAYIIIIGNMLEVVSAGIAILKYSEVDKNFK